MNLAHFTLKNYQVSLVTLILLLCLGVMSLISMPRSEDPQFAFPAASIRIVYPGTNPLDIEKLIVDPLEAVLNELEDIKMLTTEIEDGMAMIRIEFIYGEDPEEKYDDVVAAVGRVRDQLPDEIQYLSIEKIAPSETNILQFALTGQNLDYRQASYFSERLKKRLQRVKGIKQVNVDALPDQYVSIRADLDRMRSLAIPLTALVNAVEGAAQNIPAGHVNAGERRFSVRTSGDFRSLEEIRRTIIKQYNDQLITVADVADVEFDTAQPTYLGRYQDQPAVFISLVQRTGTNIFDVVAAVNQEVEEFKRSLPANMALSVVHDQSVGVDKRIGDFFDNLLQGLLVVGLLTLLLLGARASLVIVLAIPMSVLIGLGWLDLSGFGLQQMSIVGLVIALGLLVDNAIVVTENVGRYAAQGLSGLESARKGAGQVSLAVASGTLTTILAFFPVLLLPSGSGTFMRSMPVTVVLTLFASLLVAIAFTPLLAGKLLGRQHRPPLLQRGLQVFADKYYRRWLNQVLNYPRSFMLFALVVFIACVSLFPAIGVSLFPKAEKPAFLVDLELPEGASFTRTTQVANDITHRLQDYAQIERVAVNIGRGNPRIYYNIFPNRQVSNYAQLYVQTQPLSPDQMDSLVSELRQTFGRYSAARISIKEFQQGPPAVAPVEIRIEGDNLSDLRQVAIDVEAMMEATPGTVNIDNPIAKNKVDIKIDIDRQKAALSDVSLVSIDQTIRASLSGYPAGNFRDERGEDFSIVIRKAGSHEPDYAELHELVVSNQSGQLMPLSQLADIHLVTDIPRFRHLDLQRMVIVTADVINGFQTEVVTNDIVAQLEQYAFPDGVRFSVGGEQKNRKESFSGMNKAFMIALLGIFAVLVMQFRSFSQPIIIFAAIPFAVSGAFLGLWITGYTFSFTAFIGLTSLIGIVVNNSIILVDFANQLIGSGRTVREAILTSAQIRLSPILLTSLTTVGGLLPLTLEGSSMWSPMGWSIIFGLSLSTLLTLFVIPILYQWFNPGKGNQ